MFILIVLIAALSFTTPSQCADLVRISLVEKQANQVSTYRWPLTGEDFFYATADKAIDGHKSAYFPDLSCTHTLAEMHPWWKVDLELTHCLGVVTVVNRNSGSKRLSSAVVRAGLNENHLSNAACGSPVTSAQAQIPGAHLTFECNPPVDARYVSVDIDSTRPGAYLEGGKIYLTLCEVMVEVCPQQTTTDIQSSAVTASGVSSEGTPEERRTTAFHALSYPTTDVDGHSTAVMTTPRPIAVTRISCRFKLIYQRSCVKNPRPLVVVFTNLLMPCAIACNRNDECWSFDYAPTTGRCRLFDAREEALEQDSELDCVVYAVVGCNMAKSRNGICSG